MLFTDIFIFLYENQMDILENYLHHFHVLHLSLYGMEYK